MANKTMKTLTIGNNTYEIVDESARANIKSIQNDVSNVETNVETNVNDITGLKSRMTTAETDIENLKNNTDTDNTDVSELPEYAQTEMAIILKKLRNKMDLNNPIIIGFHTDQHLVSTSTTVAAETIRNGMKVLTKLTEQIPFNLICLGGDATASQEANAIQSDVSSVSGHFYGAFCPVVHVTGNHDSSQDYNGFSNAALYKTHFQHSVRCGDVTPQGFPKCNGYLDDESVNVRYIFLDDTIRDNNRNTLSDIQGWLTTCLSDLPTDYKAIIFSHHPLNTALDSEDIAGTGNYDGWNNPVDCGSVLETYADKIICCICGHVHNTLNYLMNGVNYISTTTAGYNQLLDGLARTAGTADGTAFDVYVFDMDNNYCYIFRYGVGEDREIDFTDGSVHLTHKVTNKLTNITSDNSATKVESGSSYTATLSYVDGYEITAISVTMDGVNITSSVYSNGVISIPSVTGDVVITAAAYVSTSTNGIVTEEDGTMYYYQNGEKTYAGLFLHTDGYYYYARTSGQIATGTYTVSKGNDIVESGKNYTFDDSGRLYFSVKNKLTDVTSNNTDTVIYAGKNYNATLTSDGDIDVVVTVNGTDVTTSVYSDGVITINNVLGDIVITATKLANEVTNVLSTAIDTDGSVYNSIGYKEGYRLSSGGKTESAEGYDVTGYIPVEDGDTVYFDGITSGAIYNYYILYGKTFNKVQVLKSADASVEIGGGNLNSIGLLTVDSSGNPLSLKIQNDIKYIRFSCSEITNASIVTKNDDNTNLLTNAIDSDGTLYNNGQGWKADTRLNSSGIEKSATGYEVTGFIPYSPKDVFKLSNITMATETADTNTYVAFYDADFNKIISAYANSHFNNGFINVNSDGSIEIDYNIAYLRFAVGNIDENSVVAINEQI